MNIPDLVRCILNSSSSAKFVKNSSLNVAVIIRVSKGRSRIEIPLYFIEEIKLVRQAIP